MEEIADEVMATDETQDATETDIEQESQETEEQSEESQADKEPKQSDDNTPWPKKAQNALSRRDRQIGKMRAENQAYQKQMAEMQERLQKLENPAPKEPSIDDFDTFEDYIKALTSRDSEGGKQSKDAEKPFTKEQAIAEAQKQLYVQQKTSQAVEKAQDLVTKIPNFQQTMIANQDVMDALPAQTQEAFLGVDNPYLAAYTLSEAGLLEQMVDMPIAQAAVMIAKAEMEGQKFLEKQVSKAPPPMKGATGANTTGKTSLDRMNPDQLMKWVNS